VKAEDTPRREAAVTADAKPARPRAKAARWALYALAAAGLASAARLMYRPNAPEPVDPARPPGSAAMQAKSTSLTLHPQPRSLPPLRFADGAAAPTSLAAFRGKFVLLNVWATWCTPCREEMPTLDRLQATLGGPDFEVVALSIDQGGMPVVQDFFRQIGIKRLHPYMDQFGETTSVLGVVGLPLTLLIDRQGREIARKLGPAVWDAPQIVELIRSRLGTPAGAAKASASAAPDLAVSQAWARPTMPGQDVAAVYLTVTSARGAALVGVRSDAADIVQVHDMTMDGGVMKMRERERLPLPAGQAVRLQPGGTHLMMQQLKKPLRPGEQVALSLALVDPDGLETVVRMDVPVRTTPPAGS
jgi:copper(I)-binding protein/thiol-disulfide isomerase/thioredoxin